MTDTRTRTFSWDDPVASAAAARGLSGLDHLRAMMAGRLPAPPIMLALGIRLEEAEEGRVVFAMTPAEFHYNPIGSVHGGVSATLLDSAMGCAVHSTLPAGVGYTTLEFKVNLTRALTRGTGEVRCEGRIVTRGRRVAVAEADIRDGAGRVCAHATTTCLVLGD